MTAPSMVYRPFGRTGLTLSRVGLGAGGPSRLGRSRGAEQAAVDRLVRRAVDLGINVIDTAAAYGTEEAIGAALAGGGERVHLATKVSCYAHGPADRGAAATVVDPERVALSVEHSLRALRRERLDIVQLHGVRPASYDAVVDRLYPVLARLRDAGKIGFIGLTETPAGDPAQEAAARAARSGLFDTLMVQHAVLDQQAERGTFAAARAAGVGVFGMCAARGAFTSPEQLRAALQRLGVSGPEPLSYLLGGPVGSYADAAYRFVAGCPDVHVVLVGTGDPAHLSESAAAVLGEPLPATHVAALRQRFGHLDGAALWAAGE